MTVDLPYSIERPVGVSKQKRAGEGPTNGCIVPKSMKLNGSGWPTTLKLRRLNLLFCCRNLHH